MGGTEAAYPDLPNSCCGPDGDVEADTQLFVTAHHGVPSWGCCYRKVVSTAHSEQVRVWHDGVVTTMAAVLLYSWDNCPWSTTMDIGGPTLQGLPLCVHLHQIEPPL